MMLTDKQTCLVLIDMQDKLVRVMHEPDKVVANCAILLQMARMLNIPIVWCQQSPQALGPTVQTLQPHLDGISPIDKLSFSCCGQPEFTARLEQLGTRTAILCGIESHVCVFQTASDLLEKSLAVHIIADAVTSRTPENKQVGLGRMAAEGAVISSTEMALFELLGSARHDSFRSLTKLIR